MRVTLCGPVLGLLLVACLEEPVPVLQTGPPTYYEDVTPILADQCWCCHQEGGRASPLIERERVERDLDGILSSMEDGTMPPGNAASGCRTLTPAASAATDIEVIRAWRDGGLLAGDPESAAAVPPRCGVLEGPLTRLATPGHTFIGGDTTEAWCFPLDPGLESDAFLVGLRFEPGSPLVRNMLLQPAGPATPTDPDGAACPLDASAVASEVLAAWTPGTGDVVHPEGTGVELVAGAPLVLRVQYDARRYTGSLPVTVTSAVELALADEVTTEGTYSLLFQNPLHLEPGREDAAVAFTSWLTTERSVHGAALLMFDHGTSARVEIGDRCLLDVPAWGTDEPAMNWLATPLPASEPTIEVECHYDTTDTPEALMFGDPPDGEICLALLYTTP